jgi:transcriptional regulator with XRE-family HTH domain
MSGMATDPHLGTRIRLARQRLHWSQQQLADATGVDVKTVRNWERTGRVRNRQGAIEAVLGVSLGDEDELAPEPEEESARLRREVEQLKAEMQAWREVALEAWKGKGDDSSDARAV